MKRFLVLGLIMTSGLQAATNITLSHGIKKELRHKIERDLSVLDNINFKNDGSASTLKVMGLNQLNSHSASNWLDQRVNYVISENALSLFNLLVRRVIFKAEKNVEFPNADIIPYSLDTNESLSLELESQNIAESEKAMTVMSNIGAALYLGGKTDKTLYGMKISRGLFKLSEKVEVTSPRVGIIQIGEGLFSPDLTLNNQNPQAFANSIFRLGTFFHEARHSDGNGMSLGFLHATCPKGHDYEGEAACDENLNGPYTVGAVMMTEMAKSCDDQCLEKEKEVLKLMVLDSANRVLLKTNKGERSKNWDPKPEALR